MSTVKSKNLQVGTDATASNNFTIYQPSTPDGTLRVGVGNADSPTEVGRFTSAGYKPATAPAFAARLSTNQSINTNTWTKMALATETFDTNNNFDNVTNYRFTPTVAGYYYFTISGFASVGGSQRQLVSVYKNGSEAITGVNIGTTVGGGNCTITSGVLYANGSTDYFEGWYYQDSGSTVTLVSATQLTWFDGHLVQQA